MKAAKQVLDEISEELGDKHYYNLQHHRYSWIIDQIVSLVPPGGTIADVGAAPGHLSMALAKLGYKVTAFDFAPEAELWETAPEGSFALSLQSYGVELRHWDVEVNNPTDISEDIDDGTFDCVIFTEVLEHVYRYPFSTVRQVSHLLKSGGICIVTTPNRASLTSRVKAFWGIPIDTRLELLQDNFPPHMRHVWLYTISEVQSILQASRLSPLSSCVKCFHLWTTTVSSREILPYWKPINLKQILKPLLALIVYLLPQLGETVCVVAVKRTV